MGMTALGVLGWVQVYFPELDCNVHGRTMCLVAILYLAQTRGKEKKKIKRVRYVTYRIFRSDEWEENKIAGIKPHPQDRGLLGPLWQFCPRCTHRRWPWSRNGAQ